MIDPSNCIRYTLREDIESVCQKLIFWLSDNYPEIFLIHQESYNHCNRISTRLTLIHRHWGPTFSMEFIPLVLLQTLILILPPPDPGLEDVSHYEDRILEYLPGSSISIRLARVDGNDEKELSLIRNVLREQRHHYWMYIHSGLIRSFLVEPYVGDPEGFHRDIPKDNEDIKSEEYLPSQYESMVLDLWAKGYTAKQIALRTGRTEKTILNRVTLMRLTYGEQLVPRHRMA